MSSVFLQKDWDSDSPKIFEYQGKDGAQSEMSEFLFDLFKTKGQRIGQKAGLTTDKVVDRDVAVKCRRRALELFHEKDSYLSKSVDPALATFIETPSHASQICSASQPRSKQPCYHEFFFQ